MQKLNFYLLVFLIVIFNNSCTKEQFCKNKSLCDIAGKFLPVVGAVIGVDLSIVSTILNVADESIDCTEIAGVSDSNYNLYYREEENQSWSIVSDFVNNNISIPKLNPGAKELNIDYIVKFNKVGYYEYRCNMDHKLAVDERNENNNSIDGSPQRVLDNNLITSNSFYISCDSFGNCEYGDKPQVEVISITIK